MACGDRRMQASPFAPFLGPYLSSGLLSACLLAGSLSCKREDPEIRALTKQAAQADEAAQQLRQAWSDQFQRFIRADLKNLPVGAHSMRLTTEQRLALEARVRVERDSSRRGLLREILDQDLELLTLSGRLTDLQASLPVPELVRPHDSHYGLALRFLKGRGLSEAQARKALSRVAIAERLAPGFEIYHFYLHGEYGTWVAQGRAPMSPRALASQDLERLNQEREERDERDEAVARGRRLSRELSLLESQKQLIEQEIAAIQAERVPFLEGRSQLQTENAQQLAQLNSLHYLVGVRDALEAEGIIEVPLFGKDHQGRTWQDTHFTQHLDLRSGTALIIKARDLGLRQIGKVSVVPGSYAPDEHYRLTLSADRQTATVTLLALPRFKNDKVVFAVAE